MEITQEMFDRECAWEKDMADAGREQYLSSVAKAREKEAESHTQYGHTLLVHSLQPVVAKLEELQQKALHKAGKGFTAFKFLRTMDMRVVAYIGLRSLVDSLTDDKAYTAVAIAIGKRVEDEAKLTAFKEFSEKEHKRLMRRTQNSKHYGYKINSLTHGMNRTEGWNWDSWGQSDKLHIGTVIIGAVIEATGLFKVDLVWQRGKELRVIRATEKTIAWVEKHLESPILSPWFLPTIVPPKEWNSPMGGGYHSTHLPQLYFVKTYFRSYNEEIANRQHDMANIYKAVNLIQSTPWTVNREVLNVLEQVWDLDYGTAGLPPRNDRPLPHCPICGNEIDPEGQHSCFASDPEALKGWKQAAAKVHQSNAKLWSKRIQTMKILWVARKCAEHERIYFPHTTDFRGRIYTVPMYLQPQGCDLAKGLLRFADGKPLGKTGGKWLAIHLANSYGVDKVSFEDRLKWVEENTAEILDVAKSPMDNLMWMEADSPWCFLAACFEWAGFKREGEAFVSHLPIALDGSCNGLQHFSAMLRDPVGGAAVNLIPTEKPADIYQTVADRVVVKLEALLKSGNADPEDIEMAQKWLTFGVNRKVVKRPVMVLPYGGTRYSCGDYLEEAITEAIEAGKNVPWDDCQSFEAALFLSGFVWDAISETLVGATQVMAWLQKVARLHNKAGIPVLWQSPSKLPVLQSYPEVESRRIKTQLLGSMIYSHIGDFKETLDQRRQVSGISPNFVHSMDAAALVLTTLAAAKKDITTFAMIHDSYGTYACDTEVFHDLIRKTFCKMYSDHDVLQEIYDMTKDVVEGSLPKPPAKGTLDLTAVKESLYFFA